MKRDYYLIGWHPPTFASHREPGGGSKIAAIKALRRALGIGLNVAKEIADDVEVYGSRRLSLTDEEHADLKSSLRLLPAPPLVPEPSPADDRPRVKVRVAVVVNSRGDWNAAGWNHSEHPEVAMSTALDGLENDGQLEARYWLDAELPVPQEVGVEAIVVEEVPA